MDFQKIIQRVNELEARSDFSRTSPESQIFTILDDDEETLREVERYHKPEQAETKARIKGQLLASTIAEEGNIFGVNKVIASNSDLGIVVREEGRGTAIERLKDLDYNEWVNDNFLALMLTLDRIFHLDIRPTIDTNSITLALDKDNYQNIGFMVNDYVYEKGLSETATPQQSKNWIVDEIEHNILPHMKSSYPDELDDLEAAFRNARQSFLDSDLQKYEKDFAKESADFEPLLSSIASKIDHNNCSGQLKFKEELSAEEQAQVIGFGGECLAIKSRDESKVAKIYYRGDSGALKEIIALDKAKRKGLHATALPIAIKDNIVIETKLPGITLRKYLEEGHLEKDDAQKQFAIFLARFFRSFENIFNEGLFPDPSLENILYDPKYGFFFQDLCLEPGHHFKDGLDNVYSSLREFCDKIVLKATDDKTFTELFEATYDDYVEADDDRGQRTIGNAK